MKYLLSLILFIHATSALAVRHGQVVNPKDHPQVVFIEHPAGVCTGVIVGRYTVLTALHCVPNLSLQGVKVDGVFAQKLLVPIQEENSKTVLDLALIQVRLDPTRPISPIALEAPKNSNFNIYFLGYGQSSYEDNSPPQLRMGKNKTSSINQYLINFEFDYEDLELANNSGALPGDSGGPLYQEGEISVLGIASKSTFSSSYVNLSGPRAKKFFKLAQKSGYNIDFR